MHYWFRPKRFWRIFAAYYPSSREGWVITLMLMACAVAIFYGIQSRSHSVGDMLLNFAPWAIVVGVVFDYACFRFGEYPRWWRKFNK